MRRASVLIALLALGRSSPAQEILRIEGLHGRVETLGSAERVELLTGLGPRDCPGPGLLEAGSMASARLFWPGRASLLTQGRAGLEWRGGAETSLRVLELQQGELEVRRGPLVLELPWCWNARFETGAYRLRALPGGALEIETVAGAAPRLWWSRAGLMRPCAGPASGARVLLPADWSSTSRAEPEPYSPWAQVSWPWGRVADVLHVTVEPEAVPHPPEPAPLPPFDAELWHDRAREELELVGAFAIERRDDLALGRSGQAGMTLRLRSDAARPAWILRESTDLELAPGTLVVLDEHGTLLANLGAIRVHPRPEGRPAPAAAGIAPRK